MEPVNGPRCPNSASTITYPCPTTMPTSSSTSTPSVFSKALPQPVTVTGLLTAILGAGLVMITASSVTGGVASSSGGVSDSPALTVTEARCSMAPSLALML